MGINEEYFRFSTFGAGASVRDGSGKPAVCIGIARRPGEDLERTARAVGNAIV
ncbi:hypothetical protein [Mucilaginibacter sp. 3215]|uniref:hypothetical protein n=1 Tax=Mucilaginibacter sp. 3215 TaxID=3373912 RepID=UPI003D1A9335